MRTQASPVLDHLRRGFECDRVSAAPVLEGFQQPRRPGLLRRGPVGEQKRHVRPESAAGGDAHADPRPFDDSVLIRIGVRERAGRALARRERPTEGVQIARVPGIGPSLQPEFPVRRHQSDFVVIAVVRPSDSAVDLVGVPFRVVTALLVDVVNCDPPLRRIDRQVLDEQILACGKAKHSVADLVHFIRCNLRRISSRSRHAIFYSDDGSFRSRPTEL
mmetsp:Transcript_14141/g.32905  ORF Transcript_14141/g.32905 Transcript_14141/m.32905 type:complete len:218 (+) Transcript_14141:617-1270(+)